MKAHVFKFVFGVIAILAGFSALTMFLWNALIPDIFGAAAINFWQALGLLVFARILFSGMDVAKHLGAGMHRPHNPLHERWHKMTREEREEFVKSRRFGHHPFERDFRDDSFNRDKPEKQD